MIDDPLVSVLIPCYNASPWIRGTLESILGQSYQNIEVVMMDDGSTDDSFQIARMYESRNVKILRQANQGASVARNEAYRNCEGEFIQHLDADDFLSPDKIASQVRTLRESPPGYLGLCPAVYFYDGDDPDTGALHDGWPAVDSDRPLDWLIDMYGPVRGGMIQPGAWLTPRSVCEVSGPWNSTIDPSPDNDGEYFCRIVLNSRGIRMAPAGRVYYRKFRSGGSMSGQKSSDYQKGGLRSLDLIAGHLFAKTSDSLAKQALARRYKELAFSSYPFAPDVSKLALDRAFELGFGDFKPEFPTAFGRSAAKCIGWKLTRKLSILKSKLSHRSL